MSEHWGLQGLELRLEERSVNGSTLRAGLSHVLQRTPQPSPGLPQGLRRQVAGSKFSDLPTGRRLRTREDSERGSNVLCAPHQPC